MCTGLIGVTRVFGMFLGPIVVCAFMIVVPYGNGHCVGC